LQASFIKTKLAFRVYDESTGTLEVGEKKFIINGEEVFF
jgi:hypothetical protein